MTCINQKRTHTPDVYKSKSEHTHVHQLSEQTHIYKSKSEHK